MNETEQGQERLKVTWRLPYMGWNVHKKFHKQLKKLLKLSEKLSVFETSNHMMLGILCLLIGSFKVNFKQSGFFRLQFFMVFNPKRVPD